MIDKNLILNNKEYLKQELEKKNYDVEYIDALKKLLLESRLQRAKISELNKQRNLFSRDPSVPSEEKRKLRKFITNAEKDFKALENFTQATLYDVPNIPDPDAPAGTDETYNVVVQESSSHYKCKAATPLPHWDLSEKLSLTDAKAASKLSGAGFSLFKGKGARLLRSLVSYGLSLNEEKYTELLPPHLVTSQALTHTGHLPKFSIEQYKSDKDDLWLIPTAEVPLTAAFADTVFPAGSLPQCFMAYSLAFRRESGASGRSTRGMQRVHEFHKVELLKFAEPSDVQEQLQDLLEDCLRPIRGLELQYRVVDLCTGEMGDKYARCFDIEVYCPGVKKWLEVSSVGHFSDYQARRANIKYADNKGKKHLVYTLNGSGLATPRVWLSILETYQQDDGSVAVPKVLVPFMGCDMID